MAETEDIAPMNALMGWLAAHLPSGAPKGGGVEGGVGEETRITHGDFKLDNVVFHPTENRVIAILDW